MNTIAFAQLQIDTASAGIYRRVIFKCYLLVSLRGASQNNVCLRRPVQSETSGPVPRYYLPPLPPRPAPASYPTAPHGCGVLTGMPSGPAEGEEKCRSLCRYAGRYAGPTGCYAGPGMDRPPLPQPGPDVVRALLSALVRLAKNIRLTRRTEEAGE